MPPLILEPLNPLNSRARDAGHWPPLRPLPTHSTLPARGPCDISHLLPSPCSPIFPISPPFDLHPPFLLSSLAIRLTLVFTNLSVSSLAFPRYSHRHPLLIYNHPLRSHLTYILLIPSPPNANSPHDTPFSLLPPPLTTPFPWLLFPYLSHLHPPRPRAPSLPSQPKPTARSFTSTPPTPPAATSCPRTTPTCYSGRRGSQMLWTPCSTTDSASARWAKG